MKKVLLFAALMAVSSLVFGQESTPVAGVSKNHMLSLHSGYGVGYQYKLRCGEKLWWRLGANLSRVSFSSLPTADGNGTTLAFGVGVNLGLEWRKPLTESISFYHGPELGFGDFIQFYGTNTGSSPTFHYVAMGVAYEFGLMANINQHLAVAGELTPGVTYMSSLQPWESGTQIMLGSPSGLGKIGLIITPWKAEKR
jgi:hypothetical protein